MIQNSKWSGLFLESFRGQILSKNKVQWLDFASRLWPPWVGWLLTKTVQVHYDFMVKYSKPWLSSSLKNYYWFFQYMGSDNGDVRNILPSLGIMYFESFYLIFSFYSHFVNHFLWHKFYTWLYLFICPCFLVLNFVCSWFRLLFVDYIMSFAALKKRKKCWPLNFLFQEDANDVAYLSMDNHKTRRIWHYLSHFVKTLFLRFFLENDFLIVEFSFHDS